METTLRAGTGAAGVVMFDPAALPDDFDAALRSDPISQFNRLQEAGRLCWINTEADGGYTLGVYVSDRLPDKLQLHAKSLRTFSRFPVPGGRLFFTGIEFAFQTDDAALRKYPSMGESAEIAAGEHRAEVFDFEYPDDFYESLLREALPPAEFRTHRLMNTLAPIGCLSLLALLISLAVLPWRVWAVTALPCGLILIALPLILSRTAAYRRADQVWKDIQKQYPDFGILLQGE